LCVLFVAPSHRHRLIAAPAPQEQPVLRVSTRLVQVNIVVETRDGRPVSGLTADDFSLWDSGRPQKISFFSVQSSQSLPKALPPLPSGTFTNRLEEHAGAPASVTVILLDGLNTHFEDQAYAKTQLIKFLEQIQPKDHVALYTLGPNLRVLHDFTTDSETLVATLKNYVGKESHEVEASEPGPEPTSITVITPNVGNAPAQSSTSLTPITVGLEDYLRQTQQQSADWYSMDRTLRTLDALKTIARRLSHLPGRKNLIWVSSSFPFTIGSGTANAENVVRGQRSFGPEIERAEQLLNDANLAVYPVDARGLVGTFGVNTNLSAARSVSARLPSDNPTIEGLGQLTPTIDTMQELADETGGRAFYGTNDIMGSIRRALDDSKLTYTLGYYPADTKWDGKFHELKVRVQHSGAKVLCRRGYFAIPESPMGGKEQEKAMLEAAAEPLDATAIGLTVEESPSPQQNVLPVTVGIDTHSITLIQQQGRWMGTLDLLFAQVGPTGQVLKGLSQPIHLRLTDDEYHRILEKGLSISGRLQLVGGVDKLKVIAFDQSSNAVGSVTVPLEKSHGTTPGTDKR
jgi:VWFA-related protein